MELHFKDKESQIQCYNLWKKSENIDGLFDFEICTRHALGDGSYFCEGKAKIIKKGVVRWARDGWLTETKFSPSDFMFHGWKKMNLNEYWFWPFRSPAFDMSICQPGSPFTNFAHSSVFVKTDEEIWHDLISIKVIVQDTRLKILDRLGIACLSGNPPVDRSCT